MADPFSAVAFYASARHFALSAMEAHPAGDRRRVPIDAGTALEHLAKASLARRSPALLAELKGESGFRSVTALLGITGSDPSAVRTVGLTGALDRAGRFVRSRAGKDALQALVDMRNGIVHAAGHAEIEGTILAAFVQHCDALLTARIRRARRRRGRHMPSGQAFCASGYRGVIAMVSTVPPILMGRPARLVAVRMGVIVPELAT